MALTVIVIFACIGILDVSYLIFHMRKGTPVKCLFFPQEMCDKVQHAPQSRTFGIPNPIAGFGMYALILVLAYLGAAGMVPFMWMQALIWFGFLFSIYFMYVQAFVLEAYCTWCVVSAINFTVMAIAAFYL
ncbi:MAG: vitamin K epoxide reductase family protein [Patescibacteria group bacterium]|nr:vitamin K epoxide reductase family protein [Patescibacteria group bacterium]